MSHQSVVAIHKDTALSLADNMQFGYGRQSDFNQIQNKRYPYIWLALLSSSASFTVNNVNNYTNVWSVTLLFCEMDREDSIESTYEKILDRMDVLADKFINTLNLRFNEMDADVILQGISKLPFIKDAVDDITGWIVQYQLLVPDDFDYCSIDLTTVENDNCGDS
jgi:hypothetical protein